MKRNAIVISLLICWIALFLGAGPAVASSPTTQDKLLASCQRIQQYLTLPPETSAEQRALVALNIAIAQSQPLDESVDLGEVLRKANSFTTYLLMSDTVYEWQSDSWVGVHRTTYTYGSGNRKSGEVEDTSSGGGWAHYQQVLSTYDGTGRLSTTTSQKWQSSSWINQSKTTLTYDGSGSIIQSLSQNWSGSVWVNSNRLTFAYSAGHVATATVESWQPSTSSWNNTSKMTYTYNGSGNLTEFLTQVWQSSSWVNSMRMTSTYDGSGDEIQSVSQMWQSSAWVNTSKDDYMYNGSHNKTLDLSSTWMAYLSQWMATDADTFKYSGGHMTEEIHVQVISGTKDRTQYTYDGNGNNTLMLNQDWDEGSSSWLNNSKTVFYYQQALAVEVDNGRKPSVFELSQNYPNPFNPVTAIRYSLYRPSQVSITVFNVLGQEVKTLENSLQSAGVYETTWDGTGRTGEKVASGIYFYRIKAGEFSETRKMLLLK